MVKEIMKQQPLSSRKRCIHRDTFWYRIENKKMVVLASLLGNELGLDVDMKYINNNMLACMVALRWGRLGAGAILATIGSMRLISLLVSRNQNNS